MHPRENSLCETPRLLTPIPPGAGLPALCALVAVQLGVVSAYEPLSSSASRTLLYTQKIWNPNEDASDSYPGNITVMDSSTWDYEDPYFKSRIMVAAATGVVLAAATLLYCCM